MREAPWSRSSSQDEVFPNNRGLAKRRLHSLKARLKKDAGLHEKYKKGINNNVNKGYASKIRESKGNDIQAVWDKSASQILLTSGSV